jgi:tRNA (guanine37-N1)-methyltransferase
MGLKVPEVLVSGNHEKVRAWREEQSLKITQERRPDLLKKED